MVVEKPPGLQMEPDSKGNENLQEAVYHMLGLKKMPYIINRLDRWVGGLVILGLNKPTAASLNKMFEERRVKKVYRALVEGRVKEPKRLLKHYLFKDHLQHKALISDEPKEDYRLSKLTFEVESVSENHSSLKIELGTGRYHQIRAQLSAVGHPILGDQLYGAKDLTKGGLYLWSAELEFTHPQTNEALSFMSIPHWINI